MRTWSGKFMKNRMQNSLVKRLLPKQKEFVLSGTCSDRVVTAGASSTSVWTSKEVVTCKNQFCIWRSPRDWETYIFRSFENNILLVFFTHLSPSKPKLETTRKERTAKNERIYSYQNMLIAILKFVHLPFSNYSTSHTHLFIHW